MPMYKYEYNEKSSFIFSLRSLCELDLPIEIFGGICKFYFENNCAHFDRRSVIEEMIDEEQYLSLDWLSENTDMVIRKEIKECDTNDFCFIGGTLRHTKEINGNVLDMMKAGYIRLRGGMNEDIGVKLNRRGEIIVKDCSGNILNP